MIALGSLSKFCFHTPLASWFVHMYSQGLKFCRLYVGMVVILVNSVIVMDET